jgi:hypothetical protein
MLLTALQPPPPTPKTQMRGFSSVAFGADREMAMDFVLLESPGAALLGRVGC